MKTDDDSETPRGTPSGRFPLKDGADGIPKSIRNRFQNLDFDDTPVARPRRSTAPEPAPEMAPAARNPPSVPTAPQPSTSATDDYLPAQGARLVPGATYDVGPTHRAEVPPRPGWSPPPRRPSPPPRGAGNGRFHVSSADAVTPAMRRLPPPQTPSRATGTGHGPGVQFEEIVISLGGRRPGAARSAAEPPTSAAVPESPGGHPPGPWRQQRRGNAPVTLSMQAARRIRLMAHQAGVPGAGLRLLVGPSGAQKDCEFVFEAVAEPDDIVILEQGVHIYLDPLAFETLRGVHITFDAVPGAQGFRIGRSEDHDG